MTIGLFRAGKGDFTRAGTLYVDQGGQVSLKVEDERHGQFLKRLMAEGVTWQGRRVTPNQGEDFLKAVLESVQTSYWRAWDDSQGAPKVTRRRSLTPA